MTDNTTETEQEHFAAAQEEMEHILPRLQESAASTGVDLPFVTLAESSCLGAIVANRQEQTRWEGFLRVTVTDQAQAEAAVDALAGSLEAEGWTFDEDISDPAESPDFAPVVAYRKDGIILDVSYGSEQPDSLEIFASTSCVDHPRDHQMVRSTLDPSYGKSSKYYSDGE